MRVQRRSVVTRTVTTGEFPLTRRAKATDSHPELLVDTMFGVTRLHSNEKEKRRQTEPHTTNHSLADGLGIPLPLGRSAAEDLWSAPIEGLSLGHSSAEYAPFFPFVDEI